MDNLIQFQEMEQLLNAFMQNNSIKNNLEIQKSNSPFCFYPGSFNPWHAGHSSCVNLHFKYFAAIPLMVLPDHSPHKDLLTHAPIKQQLGAAYLSHVFRQKNKKNPTLLWINYIKSQCPNLPLGLLLGLDSFLNLPKWYKYQDLLRTLSFLEVIPRKIENLDSNIQTYTAGLQKLSPKLKIHLIPENPFESVSSTELRQK